MKKISTLLGALAAAAVISAPAFAADMRMPMKAPPMVAPVFSWAGLYIGGNAGGVFSRADFTALANPVGFPASGPAVNVAGTNTFKHSGFTGGGQIGYNWQSSVFVYGLEADIQYTDAKGRGVTPIIGFPGSTFTQSYKSDWLATFRGRLGFASGPVLFYGTAGLAVADVRYRDSVFFAASGTNNTATNSQTRAGWTAGGGIEWAFAPKWSVKFEGLYVDLGKTNYTSANSNPVLFPVSTIAHGHRLTEGIGRAGINYHF